ALASGRDANGLPGMPAPVSGSTRRIVPFSVTGPPAGRRTDCERSAPPSAVGAIRFVPAGLGGSAHGFLTWPQSAKLKLAPSPPPTYSAPSGPNVTVPTECDGYCWHQPLSSTCSAPVATPLASIVSRDSLPVTRQPSSVGPGGDGQPPPRRGALPPGSASYV